MSLFARASATSHEGWKRITLEGFQLHRQFRDSEGMYRYGLLDVEAASEGALETSIVEVDATSVVNFAVIDGPSLVGTPAEVRAFRHDLDFYVFVSLTREQRSALKDYLESHGPASVLCLSAAVT